MARQTKAMTALKKVKEAAPVDPLETPEAVALTERFWEVRKSALKAEVDAVVEMGRILIEGESVVQEAHSRWVKTKLLLSQRSSWNYTALAKMADQSPDLVEQWKPLGLVRLYRVAALPAAVRERTFEKKKEEWSDPAELNDREFREATEPERKRRTEDVGMDTIHSLRRRIRNLFAALENSSPAPIKDLEFRRTFRNEISALVRSLRSLHLEV